MTEVNTEFLKLVVKELESDLSRWNQAAWCDPVRFEWQHGRRIKVEDCGTTYCLAGMAVHQAGYSIDVEDVVYDGEGNMMGSVRHVATNLLGLDSTQSNILFNSRSGYRGFESFKELITNQTGVTFDD